MTERKSITARFDDYGAFEKALHELKHSRFHRYEAFGPTNLTELEGLMPSEGSFVRGWTTAGAITGLITFFLMCAISALIYGLFVGGKPPVSNVPYVVVTYEGTILVGGIVAMIAALVYARLRPRELPPSFEPEFTGDAYGIRVKSEPRDVDRLLDLLKSAGAVDIHEN